MNDWYANGGGSEFYVDGKPDWEKILGSVEALRMDEIVEYVERLLNRWPDIDEKDDRKILSVIKREFPELDAKDHKAVLKGVREMARTDSVEATGDIVLKDIKGSDVYVLIKPSKAVYKFKNVPVDVQNTFKKMLGKGAGFNALRWIQKKVGKGVHVESSEDDEWTETDQELDAAAEAVLAGVDIDELLEDIESEVSEADFASFSKKMKKANPKMSDDAVKKMWDAMQKVKSKAESEEDLTEEEMDVVDQIAEAGEDILDRIFGVEKKKCKTKKGKRKKAYEDDVETECIGRCPSCGYEGKVDADLKCPKCGAKVEVLKEETDISALADKILAGDDVEEALTAAAARAVHGARPGVKCPECGFMIPKYSGRYPNFCPECGSSFQKA